MSEYNPNGNLNNGYEPEISNKTTLDKEKIIDRILISVLIVFCIVLTILGIDIEKKLKIINEKEPVVISAETTVLTSGTSALPEITTAEETTTNVSVTEVSSEAISTNSQQTTLDITTIVAVTGENTQQQTTEIITSSTNHTSAQTTLASTTQLSTSAHVVSTEEVTATKPQHDGKYYITASGKKYHRSTCSYLSKTKIEIDFDEAQDKGYSPCSRCIEQ